MVELIETERCWLVAQADGERTLVVPGHAEPRLRQSDLIATRYDRFLVVNGLGLRQALRLKHRLRPSVGLCCGAGRK